MVGQKSSVFCLIQLVRKVKLNEEGKEIVDHLESSAAKWDSVVKFHRMGD
jgi:hypothetical protein